MKPRLAILTNIISPYRIPVYRELAKKFDVAVFVSGNEANRSTWSGVVEQLRKSGIGVEKVWGMTIPMSVRKGSQYFDLRYLHVNPGYFTSLLRFKPDAIISNEMGFRSLVAVFYGKLFRKPVWIWWGGTLHTERSIGLVKKLWRRLFVRVVDRWISYGLTSTEYLLSLGIARDCILQIQNCVDETLFTEQVEPTFSFYPRPVLLFVGQMIGRKGVDLLLEAAARIRRKGYQFSLVLVGDGPEKHRLQVKAEKLGLRYAYFLPAQKPEVMPSVYRSADILVFPTLEDVWGLVANEALWCGIPVIASIYAGCTPEIVPVQNRFDPLDPESFDAILERTFKGKISPADTSCLLTSKEVANIIATDIMKVLYKIT